jgi:predicted nucleotidyltransferase
MSDHDKDKALGKIEGALADLPGVAFAYVFGSFLTGEFHDVDIAAYFDTPPDSKDLIAAETALEKRLSLPIDLQSLNRAPLAFAHRVVREGRVVLDRGDLTRLDYEERICDMYLDFKPYLDRYLAEVVYGRR